MTIEKNNTSHLECTLSDSDLFTPAFVRSDIEHGYFEDIFPITKLVDSGPIEFLLENATDKFLDLANTYLKLKLKIVKGDGSDTAEIDNVMPINYILSSLFSQVDINLGGRVVSMSTNTYSYRSISETLLNFGSEAKNRSYQWQCTRKIKLDDSMMWIQHETVVFQNVLNISKAVELLKFMVEFTVIFSIKED